MLKLTLLLVIASALGLSGALKIGYRCEERLAQKHKIFSSRITGGEDAKEGEFPYQVLLRYRGDPYCGGVLIAENVILTAAHCAQKNFTRYEVAAGFINMKEPGPNVQTSKIKKINIHPGFPENQWNDIAVMILTTPLKMTPFVQKALLPAPGQEFDGDTMLSGWGSTSRTIIPNYPDILQKAKLPLISFSDCKNYYKDLYLDNSGNICTGPIGGGLAACSGDSGGPLVKDIQGKKYVIGLVSWGSIPCGKGSPTVYAKVSSFIDFINKNSK